MTTAMTRLAGRLLTLVVFVLVLTHDARAAAVYNFSPVNQYGINLTAAYWNPIIGYVSDKSGIKLALKIGRTSADTTSYVLAREVEFAFTNHLFSPARESLKWKTLGRRQTPAIQGQIVVPAESPITDLAQLAGKDVAFPGPEALVAYKFPYAHLLSRNINVTVVFGGNMDGAFSQLFSGRVQAVGANSQLTEGFAKRENKKFRVLWTSEPLHDLALMVAPQVPEKDARAVAGVFLDMAKDARGRDVMRKASALVGLPEDAYFIFSDGSEYGAYRRFYQSAPANLR